MQRVRVIVQHNPLDPTEDLRLAARVRLDLWSRSSVEIDPDSSRHTTRRDADRNAYFEFVTDRMTEVQRVLQEYGHTARVRFEVLQDAAGTECLNCGNISTEAVCPVCQFRDIDPCPYCSNDIPRLAYIPVTGEVFQCPSCHHRVRFQFNDPIANASGDYNQPIVRISPAEAPVSHDV